MKEKNLKKIVSELANKYGVEGKEDFEDRLDAKLKLMKGENDQQVPLWVFQFFNALINEESILPTSIIVESDKVDIWGLLFHLNKFIVCDFESTGEDITMVFNKNLQAYLSTESDFYEIRRINQGTFEKSKLFDQLFQLSQLYPLSDEGKEKEIKALLRKYDLVLDDNVPEFLFSFFDHLIKSENINGTYNPDSIHWYTWVNLIDDLGSILNCKQELIRKDFEIKNIFEFEGKLEGIIDIAKEEFKVRNLHKGNLTNR